ncbi:hypothetical protein KR018_006675, partial [Drosophila ironensis]
RRRTMPVTQNGFLRYMREFRRHNSHLTLSDCALEGSREWRRLPREQHEFYRCQDTDSEPNDVQVSKDSIASEVSMPDNSDGLLCRNARKKSCSRKKSACKRKKRACKRKKRACKPKKSACRRKKRACRRKKCSKPGPVTNNPYLNFVRAYRKKHCGLKPNDLIRKAARAWCRLSEEKKDVYRRMACKVTKS